jgi:hypothetical protein
MVAAIIIMRFDYGLQLCHSDTLHYYVLVLVFELILTLPDGDSPQIEPFV